MAAYCKCEFEYPDGRRAPGEPCPIHGAVMHYQNGSASVDWLRESRAIESDALVAVKQLGQYVRSEFDPASARSRERADRLWRQAIRAIRSERGLS